MTDEHERYEQLAVGHVLGGLSTSDAAAFRSHLLGCRDCRSKVAELRGIASDLADAERDERSREPVRTELPRRTEDEPPAEAGGTGLTIRHVTIAVVVVVVLAVAMAFWNLHLRTAASAYLGLVQTQSETLEGLADGIPVELDARGGVRGVATTDGNTLSMSLTGLEPLAEGEQLVAWFEPTPDGDEVLPRRLAAGDQLDDGGIAATLEMGDATRFVVTREADPAVDEPTGTTVVEASLPTDG